MFRPFAGRVISVCLIVVVFGILGLATVQSQDEAALYGIPVLEGFAVLPADTFAEGPASGAAEEDPTTDYFGRMFPFESQPVQGMSAVLPTDNGTYLVMSDNGFGDKSNSADYLLRFYEVRVDFADGSVEVLGFTQLSDPNKVIPFPIVNEDTPERLLTGADFDLESFRQSPDGTFWFGEEFGPFLLHVDAEGVLLDAPIPTPYPDVLAEFARGLEYVQSPDHPDFVGLADNEARFAAANLPRSRGFEGMAINTSGTMLYPLMEGVMFDDTVRTRLLIQEFDLAAGEYTGKFWFYPMSYPTHAIGEMTAINDTEFLVIERDPAQGKEAAFKRVYRINLNEVRDDGQTLVKTLVADLMAIYDRDGLTQPEEGAIGFGPIFRFPFVTIESVYPIDEDTLLVINDNNFPFSSGRRPGVEVDNTEFILINLPEKLNVGK
ncbi:MAG: esterase-like activity of phytase family protein [Chloroflexi bacterium]|nr:esterase-like activity of phytase family protein [Chloroflexota bacterium]